jgi:hypothetical protein
MANIHLSRSTMDENRPQGTPIGTLAVPVTFSLVDDAGGRFQLVGNELQAGPTSTFYWQGNQRITIRATGASGQILSEETLMVVITDVNEAPYAITLDNATVAANAAVGAVVGTLSTRDPDINQSFTYVLSYNPGNKYAINGDKLIVNGPLTAGTDTLNVTSTDQGGLSYTKTFTITVHAAAGTAPANTAPPSISGVAAVGSTLSAVPGTWTGSPAPTLSYQWRRTSGTGPLLGTGTSYPIQSGDAGYKLVLVETATNTQGSASATSAATATVTAGTVSARYANVTRLIPGANTTPGHPYQGDYVVGRTSTQPLKMPGVAALPAGVSIDVATRRVHFSSAFNGQTFADWDMRGYRVDFGSGCNGITISQCLFDSAPNTPVGLIDLYNHAPQNIVIVNNTFRGLKTAQNPGPLSAWVTTASQHYEFKRNVCIDSPNDHLKVCRGLIEENFFYGGGMSVGSHCDIIQTEDLTGPLTIRYNHIIGQGDGDVHGMTNVFRLVPNSTTTAGGSAVLVHDNVVRGMGWQVAFATSYTHITYRNNWCGDWLYGPFENDNGTARVYANKNLYTNAPLPEYRPL